MVLALVGILLTLFVFITFIRHHETPIVKASGEPSSLSSAGRLSVRSRHSVEKLIYFARPSEFWIRLIIASQWRPQIAAINNLHY